MSRRSFRGVIHDGRYQHCGTVPQCMGAATGTEESAKWRCTCPTFTCAELDFARTHKLSIEHLSEMPIEWQRDRGDRGNGHGVHEGWCEACGEGTDVAGTWLELCERCTRERLATFDRARVRRGDPALRSVTSLESVR